MADAGLKRATEQPEQGATEFVTRPESRMSGPRAERAAPAQERPAAKKATIRYVGGMGRQSPWMKANLDQDPSEGAQLIRAFMRIPDLAVRRMIIDMAETATRNPAALAQAIV